MGQFSNTVNSSSYSNTITDLTSGYQDRLAKNPYYKFTDKKPTKVTYWNTNNTMSTYDQGTQQNYDQLSEEDPARYNRVNGFYLYGITRMTTDIQIEEFGPATSPIEGEAYVLPNTIIPIANDYFIIDYLKDNPILFRVTAATPDTLETGGNFYRISYMLDQSNREKYQWLLRHTVKTFTYYPDNVGTNYACILSDSDSALLEKLANTYNTLRQYYIEIFYRKNVQTFIYPYDRGDYLLYDPYLVEFLIRNKLMQAEGNDYLYVSQATFRSSTFSIEYAKTIFKNIEDRNPGLSLNSAYPIPICDPNSLLIDRLEEYFELSVLRQNIDMLNPINILDMDLFDRIVENNLYNEEDIQLPIYRNIIINYVNGQGISSLNDNQIDSIFKIEFARNKLCFYEIPILLYCLKGYINELSSSKHSDMDEDAVCPVCYMTGK